MSASLREAIAHTNHAFSEHADDTISASSLGDSSDRLSLCVHGLLIGISRWLKKKKKLIDVRGFT